MNKKKLACTAMAVCMALSMTAGAAGAAGVETNPEAERILQETGIQLVSLTDEPVTYQPHNTAISPADEIEAVTGISLVSLTDSPAQYVPVTLAEGADVRATTPPTKEAESYPYEQSWSGTVNYTYTNRYFSTGDLRGAFDASAAGKFYADFYNLDGKYLGGIAASQNGSRYEVRSYLNTWDTKYYYVILTNESGSASKSAYYKASLLVD